MPDAPSISICIPSYNRSDLIEETLRSALAQDYPLFEVVVNDNASTDGTWELVQALAAKDNRLKAFRNTENLGPVRNWQQALAHATGEYALILWSDDLIAPSFLRLTSEAMESDVGFVMAGFQEFNETGVYYTNDLGGVTRKLPSDEYLQEILFKNKAAYPVSPACALFRTADLRAHIMAQIPNEDGIDFNRTGAGPDLLTYLLAAAKYPAVKLVGEPLALFRSHASSITTVASAAGGLKLSYDWAKYFFVRNHRPQWLGRFKAITWVRYYRYGKIHRHMLRHMRDIRTDVGFLLKLFLR